MVRHPWGPKSDMQNLCKQQTIMIPYGYWYLVNRTTKDEGLISHPSPCPARVLPECCPRPAGFMVLELRQGSHLSTLICLLFLLYLTMLPTRFEDILSANCLGNRKSKDMQKVDNRPDFQMNTNKDSEIETMTNR